MELEQRVAALEAEEKEEARELRRLNWHAFVHKHDEARRAHDVHRSQGSEHFKATISFALEAVRTTAIISGGALVASLALLGATANSRPELAPTLIVAVLSFAVGVLCAGSASALAYIAQYCFTVGHNYVRFSWEHPFVESKKAGRRWKIPGTILQLIAIAAVIAAYVAVFYGAKTIFDAWHISA